VNHDIGAAKAALHQRLVAHVALDEVERRAGTKMVEPLLPGAVHEVIEGRDLKAGAQQMLADDAAEVAEAPSDEDTLRHDASSMMLADRRESAALP